MVGRLVFVRSRKRDWLSVADMLKISAGDQQWAAQPHLEYNHIAWCRSKSSDQSEGFITLPAR